MQVPGANSRTFNDLVPDVIDALQGRTDVSTIIPKYLRRTILEITQKFVFEELRRTGPQVQISTAINPLSVFLNTNDDLSRLEVLSVFVDSPNNTVIDTLDYKTPKAIEMITSPTTTGIPKFWTRFGSSIFIAPNPQQAFTMYARYQVKYPFPDGTDSTSLLGTPLLIPEDWEEIVVYGTALRVAVVKRWNDQAEFLHTYLYGDPEFMSTGRGRPGILASRMLQVERDQLFNTRQLGIRVSRYSAH